MKKKITSTSVLLEKQRGSLLGIAVGDVLGAPLEFQEPGNFQRLTDMVGGAPHTEQRKRPINPTL